MSSIHQQEDRPDHQQETDRRRNLTKPDPNGVTGQDTYELGDETANDPEPPTINLTI